MKYLGILAHSVEGAVLCFRVFCHQGSREIGTHDHPDVALDCIAMARSMAAWEAGDHASIRGILADVARWWRGGMSRSGGMPRRKKTIPKFADEDAEREFWATADSTDYVDWQTARRVSMPRLAPSRRTISPRLMDSSKS